MKTQVLIICAGEGSRWNNYTGVPKHLVSIDDIPLLQRTISLLLSYECDIYVVAKGNDERYKIEGSNYYEAKLNPDNFDVDKFLSSEELWSNEGRTIVMYGDCYFTEDAIKKIMEYKNHDWTLFARFGASSYTGCEWGECFAQSFYPEDRERHFQNLLELVELSKKGKLERCGGWEHYRLMMNQKNPNIHGHFGHMVQIDDFTEDFDYAHDYEKWKVHFKLFHDL